MLKLTWKQQVLVCVTLGAVLLAAMPAEAQYGRQLSNRATGENYNVEITGALWDPTPSIFITSESLRGIAGTKIDFVEDLGIEKSTFKQLRVVLRPAEKHKFRFEYTPIKYEADSVLKRTIVFNGLDYFVSLPVSTEVMWRAYRFGYEYDFVYRERGFVGLVLEAKYTDVKAELTSAINDEFVHARAPIPAVGVIGRGYVAANISITSEFTFFKLPDIGEDYGGRYFDFDLYGTVNFNDHVGASAGYRSFDVHYLVERDNGQMTLKGLYFGGVVRF
jgi:hypothetical protein